MQKKDDFTKYDLKSKLQTAVFKLSMSTVVDALQSNIVGNFVGNISNAELCRDGRDEIVVEMKILAARTNLLCLRFFSLFGIDKNEKEILMRASLQYNGADNLKTLLDLPFVIPDDGPLGRLQEQMNFADDRGYNLLTFAIKSSNLQGLELLLRCGVKINVAMKDDEIAADVAWSSKSIDCLTLLIKKDSRFPKNFNINEVNSNELKEIINKRNAFHKDIRSGSIDGVKNFIKNNPQLKNAFDTNNQSAVFAALTSMEEVNKTAKSIPYLKETFLAENKALSEVYALLRSVSFSPGHHEIIEEKMKTLNMSQKRRIRDANKKYFKSSEGSYLWQLISKCRLGYNEDRELRFKIISGFFESLHEIEAVRPILLASVTNSDLMIIFDFDKPHVADLDPSAPSNNDGRAYHNLGHIYIAARDYENNFANLAGVIAHELTHYTMQLTYDNNCKPYDKLDEATKAKFSDISNS